jgi:two-component system sensor histidine kinase/response regulator
VSDKQADRKPRVLVIDDNSVLVAVVADVLKKNGFEAIKATDGVAGLELARTKSPDLIVLDILMEPMNGFEVIEQLKLEGETKDIPVIFLSAVSDERVMEQGMSLGACDYVVKPFSHQGLADLVRKRIEENNGEQPASTKQSGSLS